MSGPPAAPEGSPSRRWLGRGLLLVLATAIVSGVSTFVNGYAVAGTGSDAFVTVRNALVAFALVPAAVLVARRASVRPTAREAGLLAVIGLVGGAIPFLLFFH
ncbi:MAG TPA: EamA family transporter, partial [Thermoplasmata archaeon]|nr:EamA family transporter [Thermoplasmata archaeon]